MTVRLLFPGAGVPGDKIELRGQLRATLTLTAIASPSPSRRPSAQDSPTSSRAAASIARRPAPRGCRSTADRLIAWQLNWRGEQFCSRREIYGETDDTRTVFINTETRRS